MSNVILLLAVLVGAAIMLAAIAFVNSLKQGGGQAKQASLNLYLGEIRGRRLAVPIIDKPAIEFVDVEKVLLSIAPQDADGKPLNADEIAGITWGVSDQVADPDEPGDVVTLMDPTEEEGIPVGLAKWAISGSTGTCIVSVTLGDLVERIPVAIKHGAPSALNLSAGAPIPE
jgi:hypothetical protein